MTDYKDCHDYKDCADYYDHKHGHYTYDMIEAEMMSMFDPLCMEIMPHVRMVCDRYDDPWRYPCPTREMLERWADEVMSCWSPSWYSAEVETQQFGRRRPFRSLIFALLIFELLRRRRRIFR
ncbi:hypothetical protein [Thermosediminibacter litoriperuensis]|uniref:Uncharacterized protein n=1 Tax=Thermosediminibacter litoriperuensis TaxID=291989 RepID=A0A5S5ANM0_9FIRM|nr:hypothetical protein [Thermosediminibacter litoriperuensis]TYP53257.1 hypothetical protein LZ11_01608 [Thermosediminibacter litoriperuensis]